MFIGVDNFQAALETFKLDLMNRMEKHIGMKPILLMILFSFQEREHLSMFLLQKLIADRAYAQT